MRNAAKHRECVIAFLDGKKVLYKRDFETEYDSRHDVRNIGAFDEPDFDFCIAPATISINGVEVPEPLREAPARGAVCYAPNLGAEVHAQGVEWGAGLWGERLLKRGLLHDTAEAANAHAKALILASGGKP